MRPREVDRAVPAHALLDRPRDERRVVAQPGELAWVAQQGIGAVADQVEGGFMAGDEQQQRGAAQLGLGERLARLLGGDQGRQQIVAGGRAGEDRRCAPAPAIDR
jgi:hypothetical protein